MATFKKAVKYEAKLRLALTGPSGAGKTMTALKIATALAAGGKVALVDTEHGSASKYADLFAFDVLELTDFHPKHYVDAIQAAADAGYSVIILDSLTHAWNGKGGILQLVSKRGNGPQAWQDARPIETAFIEAILTAPIHVIATIRARQTVSVETDEKNRTVVKKVGLQVQQRDDIEYEFDIVGRLDIENSLTIDKSRCPALTGAVIARPGREVADTLKTWLAGAKVEQVALQESGAATTERQPTPIPLRQTSQADPMPFQHFLDELKALRIGPRAAMDRLGVKTLAGLNYDDALRTLGRMEARNEETADQHDLSELATGSRPS